MINNDHQLASRSLETDAPESGYNQKEESNQDSQGEIESTPNESANTFERRQSTQTRDQNCDGDYFKFPIPSHGIQLGNLPVENSTEHTYREVLI